MLMLYCTKQYIVGVIIILYVIFKQKQEKAFNGLELLSVGEPVGWDTYCM